MKISPLLIAMRLNQWPKNAIVTAAFFFAYWDKMRTVPLGINELIQVVGATVIFCITSSAIYLMNDVLDIEADKIHPVKKYRPIASGSFSARSAVATSLILLIVSVTSALLLSLYYAYILISYIVLQVLYSFFLKKIALVDVMIIASGFVLRAVAGAVVIRNVTISPWLLICTFLLALFLGLCKRRNEKVSTAEVDAGQQRVALDNYDARLLDLLIAITSASTILSYIIYTLWPETVHKFGTHALSLTIPFVIFGIFRYLDLVYRHEKGDRPEKILLTDIPLLADIILYGIVALAVFRYL